MSACPCGGVDYARCCGRFIDGTETPASAEHLMRARYTATTQNDEAYIAKTWAPQTRPPAPLTAPDDATKWLGLDIRDSSSIGDSATVEFVARYKINGRAHRLHEVSRFVREDQRWLYLDGSFPEGRTTS